MNFYVATRYPVEQKESERHKQMQGGVQGQGWEAILAELGPRAYDRTCCRRMHILKTSIILRSIVEV